jgi:hypothetical protein
VFSVMQVGACVTGSWCFHPVGDWNFQEVGASIQLVLELSGSWCFHPVGAGILRELVLPSSGC